MRRPPAPRLGLVCRDENRVLYRRRCVVARTGRNADNARSQLELQRTIAKFEVSQSLRRIFRELPELTETDSLEILLGGGDTVFTGDPVSRTMEDMMEEEEGWSTVEEGSHTFYEEGDTAYDGQFSTSSIFPEHNFGNYQHFAFW